MKFLTRIFDRLSSRGAPCKGPQDKIDWQAGDVAECIGDHDWMSFDGGANIGPANLEQNKVIAVEPIPPEYPTTVRQSLVFSAYPKRKFLACYFRKVVPRADIRIAADTEFAQGIIPGKLIIPADPQSAAASARHDLANDPTVRAIAQIDAQARTQQ